MCTPCTHGKKKDICTECTACPHGRLKRLCAECKGSHVTSAKRQKM
ncbi:hypothetical protein N9L76_03375 [bacterium]|nr:hypothetical protein [bacterium]